MIRNTNETFRSVPNVRGGEGTLEMHDLLTPEEMGKLTACMKVVLPAHSSIGYHQHVTNWEHYCVLSGSGIFIDENGAEKSVTVGDMCTIVKGQSHGMKNPTDETLEILALIFE